MGSGYSFIKQMGGVLREEGRQMMDILIPRECLVCGKRLHKSEKYLCIYCESDLPLTYYWERLLLMPRTGHLPQKNSGTKKKKRLQQEKPAWNSNDKFSQ